MAFNSFEFLFLFLPAVFIFYFSFSKINTAAALILIIASIIFYAAWNFNYVPLLIASVLINFFVGLKIEKSSLKTRKKFWLFTGIIFNFSILAYYKLIKFLPLGISFWTFAQAGYLIEIYYENIKSFRLLNYFNEILFFPVMSSGPVINFRNGGG